MAKRKRTTSSLPNELPHKFRPDFSCVFAIRLRWLLLPSQLLVRNLPSALAGDSNSTFGSLDLVCPSLFHDNLSDSLQKANSIAASHRDFFLSPTALATEPRAHPELPILRYLPNMLDVLDLIVERGGNPAAVKESQRVRFSFLLLFQKRLAAQLRPQLPFRQANNSCSAVMRTPRWSTRSLTYGRTTARPSTMPPSM